MKKEYLALTFYVPEEIQEIANSVFYEFDFTGIETNSNEVTINFFANNLNENLADSILKDLKDIDKRIELKSTNIIKEKNWNEDWEKSLSPVEVSDEIIILPTISNINNYSHQYKIFINPKMSFGTGYHATTQMISAMMRTSVSQNEVWIDAGTGTGVLAILASKLGASEVHAFDNDEWSVKNAKENIEANEIKNISLELNDISGYEFPQADGILANLFSNVIIDSLNSFYESLKAKKGTLICTGILVEDKNSVITAAQKHGFTLKEVNQEDEWVAIKFKVEN